MGTRIELEITDATQYATAYRDGKPVATLQRLRMYETGPRWKVYGTDGALLFPIWSQHHSARAIASRIERALAEG